MTDRPGLWARKKSAAMRRIQAEALDMFDAHGYEAVTIEQVAEAADVSPSSVYRYFGTKEQLILFDEFDVRLIDRIEAELADHPLVEAVRSAMASLLADYFDRDESQARRKMRYAMEEPALQASQLASTDAFAGQVERVLAQHGIADLEARVTAASLVWALVAAVRHWHDAGYATPLREEMDAALAILERGL